MKRLNNIKVRLIDFIIIACVSTSTFYIISRNLPLRTGIVMFIFYILTYVLIILSHPRIYYQKVMKLLLLYGVFIVGVLQELLWKYMNEWNQDRILFEYIYLQISVTIFLYYRFRNDYNNFAWVGKWFIYFIYLTLITTNIALFIEPNLVRESAGTEYFTENQNYLFKISGAMGYSYIQAIIFLIPILIYQIKNNSNVYFSKRSLQIMLVLIIITEIRSEVFANLLVTVFISTISFISFKKIKIAYIIIALFIVISISIPNSFYQSMIMNVSTLFAENTENKNKLNDINVFLGAQEIDRSTEVGGRVERYPMLLEAFFANPILGNASYESNYNIDIAAHLYLMNRLALWGLLGFSFYLFLIYNIVKMISKIFNNEFRFYYAISIIAFLLLGLMKVVGGIEPWLMLIVVIPAIYCQSLIKKIR